ncbi:MAG TPA: TRAP transporter large permease subunit, partial [Metabacillus sp.]|nr:TRAP transporter large permease subunit [Metabacillus sp.]
PIVEQIGVDPVHFGILMMTIVTMGGMTPPVGVTMYTTTSIMNVPIEDYIKESLPFILGVIALLALLILVPEIVMFLPNMFM